MKLGKKSGLRGQQADQHVGDGVAGVGHALGATAAALEAVAGVEDGLLGLGLQGHLALQDVIDGLQGVGAVVAAAARLEVGDAHDHLGAVNAVGAAGGVKQTGGSAVVVTGSGVGVNAAALGTLGALNQILCHKNDFLSKIVVTVRKKNIFLPINYHVQFSTHLDRMQGELTYLVAVES